MTRLGFTLVELTVVLALASILFSLVGLSLTAIEVEADPTLTPRINAARIAAVDHGLAESVTIAGRTVTFYPDGSSSGFAVTIDSLDLTVDRWTGEVRYDR